MERLEILLGVCGGIAAYKTADLCSKLVQKGASVSVAMTESAEKFVGRTTFEALTDRPVNQDMFSPHEHFRGEHIGLANRAQVYVIAPATANSLAQIAHGFAPDLVSTLATTVTCPVVLAPAMNCEMWAKPAVQRNIELLKQDGFHIIEPGEGWLSCGQIGRGRMAEPLEILKTLAQMFPQLA